MRRILALIVGDKDSDIQMMELNPIQCVPGKMKRYVVDSTNILRKIVGHIEQGDYDNFTLEIGNFCNMMNREKQVLLREATLKKIDFQNRLVGSFNDHGVGGSATLESTSRRRSRDHQNVT